MAKHSKKYREAAEKVDRNNLYTPDQAIALLKSMPTRNFDEAVEAVVRLNVDPRKADQLVRGTVSLPNGTGKTVKVLVFARGPQATAAQEAGADIVGDDDLIAKVQGGFLDFDSVVATPDMMGKVSFDEKALDENFHAVADEIKRLKPSTVKGRYVTKATITSTMGPGIPVDPAAL